MHWSIDMLEIRRCKSDEICEVMSFIHTYWHKDHVLAVRKDLMDWQHSSDDGYYDYLIARNGERLLGVLGYISTRRFDVALTHENVIWLALWKVVDDSGVTGLGLRMLDRLSKLEPHVAIGVNGINLNHPPMYKVLRYEVGELHHYFVTCPGREITLASAPAGYSWPTPSESGFPWEEMTEGSLRTLSSTTVSASFMAKKTPVYFVNRFIRHPFYKYRVFLMTGSDGDMALIATRIAEHGGARVLRLVDFYGSPSVFRFAGHGLTKLMTESEVEYADLWAFGMEESAIFSAGMIHVNLTGPVVVPNYFEPFAARNGRILCAIKKSSSSSCPVMIFRADGDQDRPNQILMGSREI